MEVMTNICIYGIDNAIKGSKYPMATNTNDVDSKWTKTAVNLAKAEIGSGHDNFLNGIIAQFDLKFSNKAWVEMERYHFMDFISSQSTMHRIAKFDLDRQYIEYVDPQMINRMNELVNEYNAIPDSATEEKKVAYLKILYSNPAGFQLTAKMTTNYRQLKTIYYQRKNHRLPEWKAFCRQLEDEKQFPFFSSVVLGMSR